MLSRKVMLYFHPNAKKLWLLTPFSSKFAVLSKLSQDPKDNENGTIYFFCVGDMPSLYYGRITPEESFR